ncbi:MAG: FG-GAP-like repeat-containing protein [Acidobacteriota bacterium]
MIFTFFLLCVFGAGAWAQQPPVREVEAPSLTLDKGAMTEVEELSESLANFLLDFSDAIGAGDLPGVARFCRPQLTEVTFPGHLAGGGQTLKWISESGWKLEESHAVNVSRDVWLKRWEGFLATFSEIEDVRFKVKDAEFKAESGMTGSGRISFFLVGRGRNHQRLWVKGRGRVTAQRSKSGGWKISAMTFEDVQSLSAAVDLFSEISAPAEGAASLPPYGSAGNDDFIYHGAAAGDLNADGLVDLVVAGIADTYVYINKGNGTFQETGWDLGIPPNRSWTAPLLLDFDNDGDQDLFFAAVGLQALFENRLRPEGKLRFRDISLESGVSRPAVGFSAVAGDVNNDGLPDIYVTSYNRYGRVMPDSWYRASNGTPNLLFINQGDGSFREAAARWGISDSRWSYAAEFADLNGDGRQDLYVANDFGENGFYVNLGNRFENRAASSGVLDPGNGMGVSLGDYNNDGQLDLLVTNMSSTAGNRILNRLFPGSQSQDNVLKKLAAGNNLYQGASDGSFRDVTAQVGPFSAGWAWGGVFFDFDNDGWQDLYSPNGFISGKSKKDT